MEAYVIVCRNGDSMWVHDKTFTTIDEAALYACCSISSPVLWKVCPINVDISNEMNASDTLRGQNKDVLIEVLYDPRNHLGTRHIVSPSHIKYYAFPTEQGNINDLKRSLVHRIYQGLETLDDEHAIKLII
jgi:hypothetical protein|nr:MAG TPA: hypothetical protein [Caudoviricetes sp.]